MSGLRLLVLDIETSPHLVSVYSLWDKFIPPDAIQEPGYTFCMAYQWVGEKKVHWLEIRRRKDRPANKESLKKILRLMDEADGIVTYNGKRFDLPILNTEFLEAGLKTPAPPQNIDLYADVVRRKFKFASGKMGYVAKRLGIRPKGKGLTQEEVQKCRLGDPAMWAKLRAYNIGDVITTTQMYHKLLPWTPQHPNAGLVSYGGRPKQDDPNRPVCPRCGGVKLNRVGTARTKTAVYQRYQCYRCGYWSRDRKSLVTKDQGKRVLV